MPQMWSKTVERTVKNITNSFLDKTEQTFYFIVVYLLSSQGLFEGDADDI